MSLDTADAIVAGASSLFARHSYANVTLEQIASAVGMVPGAVYYHFKNKEELIFRCYMRGLQIYEKEIEAAAEPGIDSLEVIRRLFRRRLHPHSRRMILFTDIDALPDEFSSVVHEHRWQNAMRLAEIVRTGVRDGSVHSEVPELTAIALISMLDWMFFWYTDHDYYNRQDAIDGIDDIVVHGLLRRDVPMRPPPEPPNLQPFLDEHARLGKRAAKYERLLSVATDNFNRKGALGSSLESIAQDAGITRAGIYYHFDDKEKLLYACLNRGLDLEDAIPQSIAEQGYEYEDSEYQRTRLLLMLHDTPLGPKGTYQNINFLTDEHRQAFVGRSIKSIRDQQARYQRWIENGRFRDIDTYFAERLHSGMIHWYPIWFRGPQKWTPLEIADQFANLFVLGLKPRP